MANLFSFCEYIIAPDRRSVLLVYESLHTTACHPFTERVLFPSPLPETQGVQDLLRLLHFVSGISYYKLFLPERFQHPYTVSVQESSFLNDVFSLGLREFMYTNRLSEDRMARFPDGHGVDRGGCQTGRQTESALLGLGGGKDSVVAGELLKTLGILSEAFVVVTDKVPPHVEDVARMMGTELLVVRRILDEVLTGLSRRPGAYNGHIPVSAIYGIIGCLVALSRGHVFVTVGNESSASIPCTVWKGLKINHQWSKSLHFERLLQSRRAAMGLAVNYFSPIRPLNAISVAGLFSMYPQYFHVFTSDSASFRIDPERRPETRWSLGSVKSLSSYILLLPWVGESELRAMFGRDFLCEPGLKGMLLQLLGASSTPALDCVGTPSELRLSIEAALAQGKCQDSGLVAHAVELGLVSAQTGATAPLADGLTASMEQAFPIGIADRLFSTIAAHLKTCRESQTHAVKQAGAAT